jgi:predicted nucleotidyltransferase
MSASSHFKELLRKFNDHDVRFLIVGAYAVMKYTEPRYTKDLDIWVEPSPANAEKVYKALADFGAPMEAVTPQDFTNQDLVFQIGVEPHRIDVLMAVKGLTFAEAWARRVETEFEEVPMCVVSRKDLLVSKEAAGRPQDLLDAEAVRKATDSSFPNE